VFGGGGGAGGGRGAGVGEAVVQQGGVLDWYIHGMACLDLIAARAKARIR
jgi:hypothetical protein